MSIKPCPQKIKHAPVTYDFIQGSVPCAIILWFLVKKTFLFFKLNF